MKKHYLVRLTINLDVFKTYSHLSSLSAYTIEEVAGFVKITPLVAVNTYKKVHELLTRMLGTEIFDTSYQTMTNRMQASKNMTLNYPGIKVEFLELTALDQIDLSNREQFI